MRFFFVTPYNIYIYTMEKQNNPTIVAQLRAKSFEMDSYYIVLEQIMITADAVKFLSVPPEYEEMYHYVYWESTGYRSFREADLYH